MQVPYYSKSTLNIWTKNQHSAIVQNKPKGKQIFSPCYEIVKMQKLHRLYIACFCLPTIKNGIEKIKGQKRSAKYSVDCKKVFFINSAFSSVL
jgi:hypothetical protein